MKPIVTDTYDFPTLIRRGYVYVDKTALLHRLVSGVDGLMFFMSRPRRFGKSLMISTLEQIFKGENSVPNKTTSVRVLELLRANPRATAVALGGELGIGDRAVRKIIAQYKAAGRLVRIGSRKSGHWQLKP